MTGPKIEAVTDKSKLRNQKSRFIFKSYTWDSENLAVPENIREALREEGFVNPSKIQAYSIPSITNEPYKNLIAQSHNGSGKTLAFALSTLMRVDAKNPNLQAIVLAHSRELVT